MSNNSSHASTYVQSGECTIVYVSVFSVRVILLLPVSTFILFLGLRSRRQHRSVQTTSHFDVFTFHLAVMEFFWVVGFPCHVAASYLNHLVTELVTVGFILLAFYGEILFHTLTCVERYVAVLHPVTYLKMKTNRGVRIRNISIGCVWLACLFAIIVNFRVPYKYVNVPVFCILAFSLMVTSFCTISVLCVLTHHGETGGKKKQMDQSKHRAFYTITIISSVQWLWFIGLLISKLLIYFNCLSPEETCVGEYSVIFFNLPSCLVMPLLYLNRAGKLPCRCSAE